MRRVSTILLLLGFSFPLITSLLSSQVESKLPACCRRDGKHRCAMNKDTAPSTAASFQSTRMHCPLYPSGKAMPSPITAAVPPPAQTVVSLVAAHPEGIAQTEARFRLSFNRVSQKRGPPSLLS